MTHNRGERADCYKQYLLPVLGRSNLVVLTEAKTLKVETEKVGATTVTRGVTFQVSGQDGNCFSGGSLLITTLLSLLANKFKVQPRTRCGEQHPVYGFPPVKPSLPFSPPGMLLTKII